MNMAEYERKWVLVTGGERGIGLGIVSEMLSRDYAVIVAGVDDEAAAGNLDCDDKTLIYKHVDVGREDEVRALFDWIGQSALSLVGVISNAGLAEGTYCSVTEMDVVQWRRVIDVNLNAAFLISKYGIPALKGESVSMVFIASIRSFQTDPYGEAYAASKGGLISFVRALALSEGPRLRANSISPGWIHTGDVAELSPEDHRVHPAGRVGLTQDVAKLAAYLLSENSGFITGQDFIVDGGISLKLPYHH